MNDDAPPTWPPKGPGADAVDASEDAARRRLATLKVEHADLDAAVQALISQPVVDQIRVARLKKRKLALRDEIARLEDALTPDIIA